MTSGPPNNAILLGCSGDFLSRLVRGLMGLLMDHCGGLWGETK